MYIDNDDSGLTYIYMLYNIHVHVLIACASVVNEIYSL